MGSNVRRDSDERILGTHGSGAGNLRLHWGPASHWGKIPIPASLGPNGNGDGDREEIQSPTRDGDRDRVKFYPASASPLGKKSLSASSLPHSRLGKNASPFPFIFKIVKISVGALSGIESPLRMGTGRNFFPATSNGAGTGCGAERGGDGKHAPSQNRPVAIPRKY
ncbi:hypothetical protein Cgig2_012151 [Carnegiea gigantea]|uniref:Uncharacterized protein n=1 Tax=Carnegiea gigantea TaxID=171969 RepID=A0A9Q1KSA9_9CARY|nr:hypothetical protein Cgig2_012151 [Carnegiea gigantea]